MKKIMIALAVVAVAVASQAATVKWQTGAIKLPGEAGAQSGANMSAANVAGMYLWSLEAPIEGDVFANYASWNNETKTYTLNTEGAVSSPSISRGNATFTGSKSEYSAGETAYAAALIWYDTDANGKMNEGDYYLATQGSYNLEADSNKTVNLGLNGSAWTEVSAQAVPEPTSGLLLLLGVAGLALKRKRA